jgi:broad specificity phosphatase PhoE
MEVLVVKAASTNWEEEDRLQGNLDIPLSDRGVEAAKALGRKLWAYRVGRAYSGFSLPVFQTARIICQNNGRLAVTRRRDLDEVNLGLWQGLLTADLKRKHKRAYLRWLEDPLAVEPPMGERLDRAYRRMVRGMEEIIRPNIDARAMVVLGCFAYALVVAYLRDQELDRFWDIYREPKKWEMFAV